MIAGAVPVLSAEEIDTTIDGYWSYPDVIWTFGRSKPSARLLRVDIPDASWYVRAEKTLAVLMHWEGKADAERLEIGKEALRSEGIKKLGYLPTSAPLASLGLQTTPVRVWYADTPLPNPEWNHRYTWRYKTSLSRWKFAPVPRDSNGIDLAMNLLQRWHSVAVKRHFMVVLGHYKAIIADYTENQRARMFFLRDERANIVGLIGGYIYPDGNAVTVNAKADYSHWMTGFALWVHWLSYLRSELGIASCCCGDTADTLKKQLGMHSRSFRSSPRRFLDE